MRILREPPHPLQAGCWIAVVADVVPFNISKVKECKRTSVTRNNPGPIYLRYLFFDVCLNFGLLVEFSYDAHVANVRFVA